MKEVPGGALPAELSLGGDPRGSPGAGLEPPLCALSFFYYYYWFAFFSFFLFCPFLPFPPFPLHFFHCPFLLFFFFLPPFSPLFLPIHSFSSTHFSFFFFSFSPFIPISPIFHIYIFFPLLLIMPRYSPPPKTKGSSWGQRSPSRWKEVGQSKATFLLPFPHFNPSF